MLSTIPSTQRPLRFGERYEVITATYSGKTWYDKRKDSERPKPKAGSDVILAARPSSELAVRDAYHTFRSHVTASRHMHNNPQGLENPDIPLIAFLNYTIGYFSSWGNSWSLHGRWSNPEKRELTLLAGSRNYIDFYTMDGREGHFNRDALPLAEVHEFKQDRPPREPSPRLKDDDPELYEEFMGNYRKRLADWEREKKQIEQHGITAPILELAAITLKAPEKPHRRRHAEILSENETYAIPEDIQDAFGFRYNKHGGLDGWPATRRAVFEYDAEQDKLELLTERDAIRATAKAVFAEEGERDPTIMLRTLYRQARGVDGPPDPMSYQEVSDEEFYRLALTHLSQEQEAELRKQKLTLSQFKQRIKHDPEFEDVSSRIYADTVLTDFEAWAAAARAEILNHPNVRARFPGTRQRGLPQGSEFK